MPAASYEAMRRRRMTRARVALANIRVKVDAAAVMLEHGEVPSAQILASAAGLEKALAELDAIQELYEIGTPAVAGPAGGERWD